MKKIISQIIMIVVIIPNFALAALGDSCTFDGVSINNGSTTIAYRKSVIPPDWEQTCLEYSRRRTCVNGVMNNGERYALTGEYYDKLRCIVDVTPQNALLTDRKWQLVFSDEGTGKSRNKWKFSNGAEYYGGYRVPDAVTYNNGKLLITNKLGVRQPHPATPSIISGRLIKPSKWESAHMWTKEKFTYGYFEARIKIAPAQSIDQAFWLRGGNRELDITEAFYWTSTSDVSGSTVWGPPQKELNDRQIPYAKKIYYPDLSADYHRYGMLWEPNKITFYFDDKETYTVNDPTLLSFYEDQLLNVRLSTAVADIFSTAGVSSDAHNTSMYIDYVRVFKEIK